MAKNKTKWQKLADLQFEDQKLTAIDLVLQLGDARLIRLARRTDCEMYMTWANGQTVRRLEPLRAGALIHVLKRHGSA